MNNDFKPNQNVILSESNHDFFIQFGQKPKTKVEISVLKPLISIHKDIVFTNQKKEEIYFLANINQTSLNNQKIIRQAIKEKYFLPIINKILKIDIDFGTRYWTVETDHGPIKFAMRTPSRHITHITADRLIVKDSIGNFFLIESLAKLDKNSHQQLKKIL